MQYFLQQFINGVSLGSIYALLALGVTLVWGVLDVLNFAQAQFMTWGAFGVAFGIAVGFPVWVSVLVGVGLAAGLALVVDELIVVPLRRRSSTEPFTYVVATIGVGLILETVLKRLSHSAQRSYPINRFPSGTENVGGVLIANLQILILAVTIGVMVVLTLSLARTKAGRELRAVAESREVAELLGINSRKGFALAFGISGVLAALAGMFVAIQQSLVTYDIGDSLLLITFSAIVIGGMGSIPGAVVGGLVLGLGQVLVQAYVSADLANVWAFAIMIVVLLFRPGGIFAKTVVTRA